MQPLALFIHADETWSRLIKQSLNVVEYSTATLALFTHVMILQCN